METYRAELLHQIEEAVNGMEQLPEWITRQPQQPSRSPPAACTKGSPRQAADLDPQLSSGVPVQQGNNVAIAGGVVADE